jgi:hypothetical protein
MIDFFNLSSFSVRLILTILLNSIVLAGSAYAVPYKVEAYTDTIPDSLQYHRYLTFNSFSMKKLKPHRTMLAVNDSVPSWVSDTMPSKTAITSDKLMISGIARFITYYRDMDKSYEDMITSDRNISFLDYPLANAGTISTGGYPLIEMSLTSKVSHQFNFHVGYSFAHNFTGQGQGDLARNISSRQNLFFTGNYNTRDVKLALAAGTVLWTGISKFTMSQPEYRDDYFDRLPWDWYRKSFERYENYYSLSTNIGSQMAIGTAPFQGFVLNGYLLPNDIKVTAIFGRTNRNLAQSNATTYFPSYTYAGRIEKTVFTGPLHGLFGLNYYSKIADTDRSRGIPDNTMVISTDVKMRVRKVGIYSELAYGMVDNPASQKQSGIGFTIKGELDKSISPLPVSLEFYHIDKNVVSLDAAVLNSGNATARDGGAATEFIYSQLLAMNIMQEVAQTANNRMGLIIKAEKKIGRLKVQLSTGISQELENLFDTITFQHRVNAFSRSRFRPWFQAGGPYARIKSGWRRTFETITINDEKLGLGTDYKKGFNGVDLLLKYKINFLKREIVFINFTNYNSIQDGLSIIPKFNDQAFIRTFYNELTAAYRLSAKFTLVGTVGMERVLGNNRVNLSPENGGTIDQTGYRFGTGIDYDFSPEANIHLRRTWMSSSDKNFVKDEFKGNETIIELKIYFNR